jgi:heterodisulfide reductase subunit C
MTMNQQALQYEFYERYGGKDILRCIQCGTCSGSCPLTDQMDHAPRELFALIRDNEMETVLCANTQWFCVSCYQCMVRCPQNIPVTDLMYALKQMSISHGLVCKSHKMPDLYNAFSAEVRRTGKMSEPLLMMRYGLKHPFDIATRTVLAVKLLKRGRLDIFSKKTKDPKHIRFLMEDDPERKKER